MFVPEASDPEAAYFVAAATRRAAGKLKIVVDSRTYNSVDPRSEAQVVDGLRAGRAELGFVAARDWAGAGDDGFRAVLTPFAVSTLDTGIALARSPIAADLLHGLTAYGIVGLAVTPGEPRQFLTTAPLFGPGLAGAHLRIIDNAQTAAMVKALDGVPVTGRTAAQAGTALRDGQDGGLETSPIAVLANSYNDEAHFLTTWSPAPKPATIVASTAAWGRLGPAQKKALTDAAADTVAEAARALAGREADELAKICATGVVLEAPDPADLRAMAAAVRPLVPSGARATDILRQLRALPGAGAQPQALPTVPAGCKVAHGAAEAISAARASGGAAFVHRGGTGIPPGTYVTTDSVADFHAGSVYGTDWNRAVTYTTVLRADGTATATQQPVFPDQPDLYGSYVVDGDQVTFTWQASSGLTPETVRWSYFDGQLTFAVVDVQDPASRVIYRAHPWRRTA